jgi:hypothetical protein
MKIKDIHLIAFYVMKPRRGVQTQKAGWMKDPNNFQYDERVEFTKGLSGKDRQFAGVILNLNTKTVVYNKFGKEKTFDDLFKYFLEAYTQQVGTVMAQLDIEYLKQFIPEDKPATEAPVEEAKVEETKAE